MENYDCVPVLPEKNRPGSNARIKTPGLACARLFQSVPRAPHAPSFPPRCSEQTQKGVRTLRVGKRLLMASII